MRISARRERPHPGAQLSLFEAEDSRRYTLWITNRPAATGGWLGQAAYLDAAHRVHARVEDAIRTGKDCGIGKIPSTSLAMNKAWQAAALTAATLLAWLKLLAWTAAWPGPSQRLCATASCTPPAWPAAAAGGACGSRPAGPGPQTS